MHQKSSQKEIFGQKFTPKKGAQYISNHFHCKKMSSPIKTPKRIRSTNHQATTRSPTATAPLLSWRNALLSGFRAKSCPRTFFFQVQSGTNHASYTTIRLISHHPRVFCLTFKGLTLVFGRVFLWVQKRRKRVQPWFLRSLHPGESPWKHLGNFTVSLWVKHFPQYTNGKWYDTNPKQGWLYFRQIMKKLPNILNCLISPKKGSLMTLTASGQK